MATGDLAIGADAEKFDIGRVISRAVGAIRRSPRVFLGLMLVLGVIPGVMVTLLQLGKLPTAFSGWALIGFVAGYVQMAAITHATIVDLRNGQPRFGDSIKVGLRLFLPIIGLAILQLFGIMVGFVLLVIPGLILAVMWSVALPVLVEERTGVFGAFGRSRELTKGSRWQLFAMFVIAVVLFLIPASVVPIVTGAIDMITPIRITPSLVVSQVLSAIATLFIYVGLAATYIELRYIKEGLSPESLAAVFD